MYKIIACLWPSKYNEQKSREIARKKNVKDINHANENRLITLTSYHISHDIYCMPFYDNNPSVNFIM